VIDLELKQFSGRLPAPMSLPVPRFTRYGWPSLGPPPASATGGTPGPGNEQAACRSGRNPRTTLRHDQNKGLSRGKGTTLPRIAVILGSTRDGRFADKPAAWVTGRLAERQSLEIDLVDLRDHPLPFFDQAPPAYTLRNYPTEAIADLGRRIDLADGFIALTPEYNHGYSGVLKNAMDHTFVEWRRKPIAFVGWGNVGGARAIEQLRSVTVEFEMAPLRHAVHILPDLMVPAMQAEESDPSLFSALDQRLTMLIDDLLWWAEALATARRHH
jgi:NAD(P)H-dependent FMN reductase